MSFLWLLCASYVVSTNLSAIEMQQTIAHQMNDVKQTMLNLSEMVHDHMRQYWTPTDFYTPRFGDINISTPDESLYIILECRVGGNLPSYHYLNNFGNWTTCEGAEISDYKTTRCKKLQPSMTFYKQGAMLPLNDVVISSIQRMGCIYGRSCGYGADSLDHMRMSKELDDWRRLNDFFHEHIAQYRPLYLSDGFRNISGLQRDIEHLQTQLERVQNELNVSKTRFNESMREMLRFLEAADKEDKLVKQTIQEQQQKIKEQQTIVELNRREMKEQQQKMKEQQTIIELNRKQQMQTIEKQQDTIERQLLEIVRLKKVVQDVSVHCLDGS